MHIVLGLLGVIVTILILMNRLADAGIDFRGMNPFLWHRRRQWRKAHDVEPIYKIHKPMDLAALLVVGLAKSDGDISSDEKRSILELFESEFHLSSAEAISLMSSSVYLLGRGEEFKTKLSSIIQPCIGQFTDEQLESTLDMLRKTAALESIEVAVKMEQLKKIESTIRQLRRPAGKWS